MNLSVRKDEQAEFLFSSWMRSFVEKDKSNFELCTRFVRYSENKGDRWRLLLHLDLFQS